MRLWHRNGSKSSTILRGVAGLSKLMELVQSSPAPSELFSHQIMQFLRANTLLFVALCALRPACAVLHRFLSGSNRAESCAALTQNPEMPFIDSFHRGGEALAYFLNSTSKTCNLYYSKLCIQSDCNELVCSIFN